jgi:hypothetical protein
MGIMPEKYVLTNLPDALDAETYVLSKLAPRLGLFEALSDLYD